MAFGGVGKEAITFILSGDASGLIKTFGDVEKAASKDLGKTEDHIEKLSKTATKIGAAAIGAGLSTALGLIQTVKDFEKAEDAANKFSTAVKGMGSNIDTGRIKRLATDLQQVSTVTNDQVIAAARWGAVYGLTTDQLEDLLRAAVDLSAQTGKSLDVTTKALAKAASGEGYKALGKLGLTFDETAYKADAFGTTIQEATEFAGGAAAKQVDTMSGQLERLGNNWDDLKEQIGAGANEVFEPMATKAADLTEWLAQANPELLKTVGHFTAIGSMGVTAFGGLATFAGQIVNIKDAMDGLGIKLRNAEGGLTNFGKVAAGIGAAGLAAGIYEVANAMNEAAKDSALLETEFNKLATGGELKAMSSEFMHISTGTRSLMDGLNKFAGSPAFVTLPGKFKDSEGAMHDNRLEMDDLRDGLEKIKGDPEALANALDVLRASQGEGKGTQKELTAEIDKYQKLLDSSKGKTEKVADEQEQATLTTEEWADALKATNGALGLIQLGAEQAAAASKGFGDAIEAMDTDEALTAAMGLGTAYQDLGAVLGNLPRDIDGPTAAMGGYNEEQTKAVETMIQWGDAAKAQVDSLLQQKVGHEEVTTAALGYTDQLRKVMEQAGFTTAEIDEYLTMLGLTEDDWIAAIKLSGDVEAKWKLQFMQGQLDKLDEGAQAEILADIHDGKYQEAEKKLSDLTAARYAKIYADWAGWRGGANPWGSLSAMGMHTTRSAPTSTSTALVPMATAAPAAIAPAPITINVTAGVGDPAEIGRKVIDAIRSAERVQGKGWRAA